MLRLEKGSCRFLEITTPSPGRPQEVGHILNIQQSSNKPLRNEFDALLICVADVRKNCNRHNSNTK